MISGYSKITGNKDVDYTSKEARKGPTKNWVQLILKVGSFTSIAHLNRITKDKWTKESKEWIKSLVERTTGYQAPEYQKLDPAAMTTTKPIGAWYFQLKTTHILTGTHLKRIKMIDDDDRCWWCNNWERQILQHLLKACKRQRQERWKLKKAMKPAVWSHINIVHLFANRMTIQDILGFLKNTEVGNRKTEK
jgi:hypothetical protein